MENAMDRLMPPKDFQDALVAARSPRHGGGHPFSVAWANGELTRAQLGSWAVQHFYYIETIPQQFGHLFCRLPDLDARHHLLENLLGEESPGDLAKRHPELLLKFAGACGLARDAVLGAEQAGEILPGTRAMRAWIYELVGFRHLAETAAAIMVALEGQLPTLYPKYVAAMRKMGFSDDELEFFHVHIEGDTAHAHVGLEIATRYATTRELQQRAIAVVGASAAMRWAMLDGIFAAIQQRRAA
jgi:pyrroloquinoline-quinone synthase